ncbi:hypothetical protein PC128_g24725 [Phytophthora cactorum]|nr:hypothetical protein PC120_g9498 [Phytophthora cactorum]KAG3083786.1 hypothetical protein PC121_g5625 [Phytophthora cactorum]KAG3142685.1 hypothetical protein PC128_g24725 [Phytophthora cactorum]KAG4040618.1 hypothetical protein PC123_g23842 [Phytophthora cactorum]
MASRKRKYASIEEIEEAHQSPDEEESAGDSKRRKNRLRNALYRFRQRSARVDGNERVGGNVQVRGSNEPPRFLIEQLLSSAVAPPAETAPVRVREARHDPAADHMVQQAIAGLEELQRQRRERQAEQARRRRAAIEAAQDVQKLSGNVPVELNNLSVIKIALIKKSDGQVKDRKNTIEGESAIVFGTSDNWKKKRKKNRKRGKSAIVFGTSDNWKRKPRSNGKRAKSAIAFVTKRVEP